MRLFIILLLLLSFNQKTFAGDNHNQIAKEWFEGRIEFIKKYISIIEDGKKKDKEFKGSIVESLAGAIFTRYGVLTQKELDKQALMECKKSGGVECLVRFRTLKKNDKYNRYANYINASKELKVLGEFVKVKKITSVKRINIFINTEDFNNKNGLQCQKNKSKYQDMVKVLSKEIEIYPSNFLKKSGLKHVVICEKTLHENLPHEPSGLAPSHYDQSPGVFYLSLRSFKNKENLNENFLKAIFHHEFYHIIDTELSLAYLDEKWLKINNQEYLGFENNTGSFGIDNSIKGYISKYGRSNAAEDKAEIFMYMITQHKEFKETISKDEVLYKKSQLMISRLKSISKDINKNFWKKLN